MADLGLGNVNWDEVDENATGEYEPLPAGLYTVAVSKSGVKTAKRGHTMLEYELTVQTGDYKGKTVKNNYLNINHPDKKPRDIALSEMKRMCLAMGIPMTNNSDDLLHRPFVAGIELSPPTMGRNGKMLTGNDHTRSLTIEQAKVAFLAEQNNPRPQQQSAPPAGTATEMQQTAAPDVAGDLPWD